METMALNRGNFIRLTGSLGAGLGLAFYLPGCTSNKPAGQGDEFAPNAWVRIAPDETVTIVLNKSEMGQGVATGLPTVLVDELDASMNRVKTEFAPAEPRYADPEMGDMVTGGSTSMRDSWLPLRQAGATARAMLIAAAAKQWGIDPAACTTRDGTVYERASNRSATYGTLAQAAASLPVPANVPLKTPSQFTLIGKRSQRPDIPSKVNGSAKYGIDVVVPGMVYAAIARSPVFGGSVKRFDARHAKAVPGVTDVVQVPSGIAVIAKNTWAAFQGKDALVITWNEGRNARVSTESLFAVSERLAKTHSGERVAISRGNPDTTAGTVLEAIYRGPYLAHATMEPMNATADVRENSCEVWAPTQVQLRARAAAAKVTGLPPRAVQDPHDLSGRRLRQAARGRLRSGGGRSLKSHQETGQGDVDSRRRHPARLLPPDERQHRAGSRRRWKARCAYPPGGLAIVVPSLATVGIQRWNRSDRFGGSAGRSVPPTELQGYLHRLRGRRSDRLVAGSKCQLEWVRHRVVRR
jgi:isoquinoline 1-oxidoreductase beta subunit